MGSKGLIRLIIQTRHIDSPLEESGKRDEPIVVFRGS